MSHKQAPAALLRLRVYVYVCARARAWKASIRMHAIAMPCIFRTEIIGIRVATRVAAELECRPHVEICRSRARSRSAACTRTRGRARARACACHAVQCTRARVRAYEFMIDLNATCTRAMVQARSSAPRHHRGRRVMLMIDHAYAFSDFEPHAWPPAARLGARLARARGEGARHRRFLDAPPCTLRCTCASVRLSWITSSAISTSSSEMPQNSATIHTRASPAPYHARPR